MTNTKSVEKRLAAATNGPWHVIENQKYREAKRMISNKPDRAWTSFGHIAAVSYGPDATFIAHAPTDIADLLAEVKRLEAEVEKLKAARICGCGERMECPGCGTRCAS